MSSDVAEWNDIRPSVTPPMDATAEPLYPSCESLIPDAGSVHQLVREFATKVAGLSDDDMDTFIRLMPGRSVLDQNLWLEWALDQK